MLPRNRTVLAPPEGDEATRRRPALVVLGQQAAARVPFWDEPVLCLL